jgi:hypothetical protein
VAISCVLTLFACKQEAQETAVARIENRTLTMQEIRAKFDPEHPPTEAQTQQYLQQWVADELLYREATRRGLDQSPEVSRRVEDMRRQLVIQSLLDSEIYTPGMTEFGNDEITQYFEQHKPEFTVTQPVVLVSLLLFNDRERATEFRNSVLQGTRWQEAQAAAESRGSVVGRSDSAYYTESRMWPRELWRVSTTIAPGSPSFPISTEDGYYVVYVWKVLKAGSSPDIEYVSAEIRNRLTVARRQRAYRSLIENLRSRFAVDIYVSPSFGDSTVYPR